MFFQGVGSHKYIDAWSPADQIPGPGDIARYRFGRWGRLKIASHSQPATVSPPIASHCLLVPPVGPGVCGGGSPFPRKYETEKSGREAYLKNANVKPIIPSRNVQTTNTPISHYWMSMFQARVGVPGGTFSLKMFGILRPLLRKDRCAMGHFRSTFLGLCVHF